LATLLADAAGRRCLADAVGLRCGLLMARRCPLYARPRDKLSCSGWRGYSAGVCLRVERRRLRPKGPQPAPGPISGGPSRVPRLHPRCRRVPPTRVELAVKGREGPPFGNIWPAWDTTVTCDADHVTRREICLSCSGKHWNASKTPRHVGISRGPDRLVPNGSHFVIVSSCDVDHNVLLARG
jgi:hypothetical protein